jgi:hypothetical protein
MITLHILSHLILVVSLLPRFSLALVFFKHHHNCFPFRLHVLNRGDTDVATDLEFGHVLK